MIHQFNLENGIKVVAEPMADRRTVAIGIYVHVGSANETKENNGISHLMEHMMFKGSKRYSVKEIADVTAGLGDDVNAFTSKEATALYGMTTSENLYELIMLLGDMIANPLLDSKELSKEKRVVIDEINSYADDADNLVHETLQRKVWKEDSLGQIISGNRTVVKGFTKADLEEFHQKYYHTGNMVISVAGGFDEMHLKEWLEEGFREVSNGKLLSENVHVRKLNRKKLSDDKSVNETDYVSVEKNASQIADKIKQSMADDLALDPYHKIYPSKESKTKIVVEREKNRVAQTEKSNLQKHSLVPVTYFRSFHALQMEIEQLHMNLAFPFITMQDDRRFVCSVLNSGFGGSNNSKLFQSIREESGLAYSVYSYESCYERGGLFHVDLTMQPSVAEEVLKRTEDVVRRFVAEGLSERETEMQKRLVRTELIMASESPKQRMESNAKYALIGMPLLSVQEKLDRITAITSEDVKKLAEDYLRLQQCSLCLVGDKSEYKVRHLKKIWSTME